MRKTKNGENFSHLFVPHIFPSKKHVCKTKTRLIKAWKGRNGEKFSQNKFVALDEQKELHGVFQNRSSIFMVEIYGRGREGL